MKDNPAICDEVELKVRELFNLEIPEQADKAAPGGEKPAKEGAAKEKTKASKDKADAASLT